MDTSQNLEDLRETATQQRTVSGDEIDLVELVKAIWSKKKFIAKVTAIFIALGLIIAFTAPEEYKASSILIPEAGGEDGQLGGSLGGLASLAGVDLGGLSGGANTINPALYQSVSRSTPFLLALAEQEYYFKDVGDTISLNSYYINHIKTSLVGKILSVPSLIISWIKGSPEGGLGEVNESTKSNRIEMTKSQKRIIEDLQDRVFVEMDWDLNLVTVEVEMQDPKVTADMVCFVQDYITNYVTTYAVFKSQQQLESIEKQYEAKKKEFESIQYELASFRDRNFNVTTARAKSEEERLQSNYNLAFNVYDQLAQQREAIKLQVEESKPVFTVLEPAIVPLKKSQPKRILILVFNTFLGLVISIGIVLVNPTFGVLKIS